MDMYAQMLATARSAEITIIPKTRQYQLLALCFLYGDEPFVFDGHLGADTRYAAMQNGFEAGIQPDEGAIMAINKYVKEITSGARPEWLSECEQRYGVSFPTWDDTWQHKKDWKEFAHGGVRVPSCQHRKTGQ